MSGTIEAASNEQAQELLSNMSLKVNELSVCYEKLPQTAIGRSDFLLFNQQLASITQAGIPLEKGLRELAKDIASKKVRRLINDIVADLDGGMSVEQAFEKREKLFPPLYGKILKAGIETGQLSEMLTSLNRHIEVANQTRRVIFEAIAYPSVVLVIMLVLITFIFTMVVPNFFGVLREMVGGKLPGLTIAIMQVPQYILPAWVALVILIVIIVGLKFSLGLTTGGRIFKESMLLKIPVFGRVLHSSGMSKMSEAMSMLVASGCNMPECLRLSGQTTGSEILAKEADVIANQIEKGENIFEAGAMTMMIPKLFLYSIQLGSQRNQLQDNLRSLADMYAQQTRCTQARLQIFLLPFLIILMGGIVFVTVMALFLPLISIVTSLM
jgi:type IV pilus assembly protein PilC